MKKRSIYEIEIFKGIYEDNNIEKTKDNQLMVYYIGSPYYASSETQSNYKILPVYIHWTNKEKNIARFILYKVNWLDIFFIKISSLINFDGTITNYVFPKELEKKYKGIIQFDIDTFELDNPLNNFSFVNFSAVCHDLKILKKMKDYDSEVLKNEKLLTFQLPNNKKLIIPGIEVVKYFYINSQYPSLKKCILDENAIEKLIKDLPLPEVNNHIYLNLKKRAKLKDKHLIFYFSYKEEYQSLFNDIYTKFLNESAIYAPIPSDKRIKIKVHYYERDNFIYVLKILKSTHYKEELFNFNKKIIVTHPKKINVEYDKVKPKKTPQEDADATNELKTNTKTSVSSSVDNIEVEDFNDFDFNKDDNKDFDFNLKMEEVKLEKLEKRTKKPKINQDVSDKDLSSRDENKTKGSSIGTEVKKDKKIAKILNYDELIKILKEKSYKINLHNGNFENIATELVGKKFEKFEKRINTYIDNKNTYRTYILIRIEKDEKVMFFFDIHPREIYNEKTDTKHEVNRNSILLVEHIDSMIDFHKKYMGKFIFDYSTCGGDWVKTVYDYFSEERYFYLKHSSVDGLSKTIMGKFK